MTYLMAIDSGNTRVKWGLHDGCSWLKQGDVAQDKNVLLRQEWQDLPKPLCIIVSNVANTIAKTMLSELLSCWEAKPKWITSLAYQCGVRNNYTDPSLLGSDRWAALIAAWELQQQGCLVVDVGTAMTVDALSDTGEFLGGIIVPGFDLMKKTLTTNITGLQNQEGEFHDFPDNTADAIHSGTIQALVGAVERMSTLLTITLGHVPECIVSGGGSRQLKSKLRMNANMVDNLVLEGLVLIAKENSRIMV
ncbi:MAG: type III pantothenate kinase [Nitrosomonadales bacterium]|nr:MAG: type III pantothenate kinase [Nitrosomonadales bacterium]